MNQLRGLYTVGIFTGFLFLMILGFSGCSGDGELRIDSNTRNLADAEESSGTATFYDAIVDPSGNATSVPAGSYRYYQLEIDADNSDKVILEIYYRGDEGEMDGLYFVKPIKEAAMASCKLRIETKTYSVLSGELEVKARGILGIYFGKSFQLTGNIEIDDEPKEVYLFYKTRELSLGEFWKLFFNILIAIGGGTPNIE